MIAATRPIPDQTQRQQALDLSQSFIVQAPAGSGKTELLIQRYLSLLAQVQHPEEIVAITFTRKAAAEMQGRIVTALQQAQQGMQPSSALKQHTLAIAAEVLVQDEKYHWRLQANPGRLRIQTVDSLCAYLTRQMPILSRLGTQPETLEDARELYQQAATDTLAELEGYNEYSAAVAVLLRHLDNDLPRTRDLLANMLTRRDQWLRHVADGIERKHIEGALRNLLRDTLRSVHDHFPRQHERMLLELLRFAAENLNKNSMESAITACAGLHALPGYAPEELPVWLGIVEFFLTQSDGWRQKVNKRQGFPAASEHHDAGLMKDRYTALLSAVSGDDMLRKQLVEIRNLPPTTYDDYDWEVIDALGKLLVRASSHLMALFGERNQTDFIGVTSAAVQALAVQDIPTDLALHLDYQIKHILVDEFQDISINQYQVLEALTAGWSADDQHTLFLVGDPMQSIYRFREAEVGKFLDTWQQRRLGQVRLVPLGITVNFRSQKTIVDWVNKTFVQVMPAVADIARGAVPFAPAVAWHDRRGQATSVNVHPLLGDDRQREADIIVEIVQATKQRQPDQSIAILVRSRNHLSHIVPYLRQAGIPFQAVEIDPLGNRPAIQDLLTLTRALTHLGDRVAWLALLRAPWCGLTLNDLHTLVAPERPEDPDVEPDPSFRHANTGHEPQQDSSEPVPQRHVLNTVWDCLNDSDRCAALSTEGQQRLRRIMPVLDAAVAQQGRLRLSRWIKSVWVALAGPATLTDPADLTNSRVYFDLLDEFDTGNTVIDLTRFTRKMSELFAESDAGAQLQILTMHKAKGLEFDSVILPGLGRSGRRDEQSLLLWDERVREDGQQDLLLAPIREAGETDAPIYSCLRYVNTERRTYEEARLLYVAATRARHALHLIGHTKLNPDGDLRPPARRSLLYQLWPIVQPMYETYARTLPTTGKTTDDRRRVSGDSLYRLPLAWRSPAPAEGMRWQTDAHFAEPRATIPSVEYEWAGDTIKFVGIVVHQCIQRIAEDGIEQWNTARIEKDANLHRRQLTRLGVFNAELDHAACLVRQALINLLTDEQGRWILSASHKDARNEYALTGIYQGRVVNIVIDRTFVDRDGTRWIIDYKTSRHEGPDIEAFLQQELRRYRDQLEKYAAIAGLADGRPIRCALYFPLMSRLSTDKLCRDHT